MEDKAIDPSYAVSPLKPFSHFLNLGTLVGAFPSDSDGRHIDFNIGISLKMIWAILFSVLWLGLGVGVATYCTIYNSTSSLSSTFLVKTDNANLTLTSTDQLIVLSTPWILVGAWFLFLVLSWTRINKYSDLCYNFSKRGFRIGDYPASMTMFQFGTNYFIFIIGQAIANIHIALIYCPTEDKQILFSVIITIWML